MNYAIAVIHPVDDLNKTQNFLTKILDFQLREQGEGWAEMENGALSIRLVTGAGESGALLHLDINSNDLESSCEFFSTQGFSKVGNSRWASQWREEIRFNGPYCIHLTVFQEHSEDDLGILPELSTSLDWHEDAQVLTRKLLRSVPVSFRERARVKVTECAEADAVVNGLVKVDLNIALHALVKVTPEFQHKTLKQEMEKLDINSALFINEE